jgi:hypothetical protein
MINYLMTSVTHAWNFLHGWVRIILYNEGGEGSGTSFACAIDMERLGSWHR